MGRGEGEGVSPQDGNIYKENHPVIGAIQCFLSENSRKELYLYNNRKHEFEAACQYHIVLDMVIWGRS